MPEKLSCFVLGAGVQGPAAAHKLLRYPDVGRVILADADQERALQAVRQVACTGDALRLSHTHLDVSAASDREIIEAFGGHQVVLSAIPASYSPSLAPLALQAGAHFCDLGGVTKTSLEMHHDRELFQMALRTGRSVILDCGFAPGLSGQMTQVLFYKTGARRIVTYVGGLPQSPKEESFYWQRTFSAKGLVELLGPALTLRDGVVVYAPPCSSGGTRTIPGLGTYFPTQFGDVVESRITAGAGLTPEIMRELGVRDCWEETLRWNWDAFLKFIETVPEDQRVQVLEERLPHTSNLRRDIAVMEVVATMDNGSTGTYRLMCGYDWRFGMPAMAKVTGFSAAAVAHLAAQGSTPPGVLAPEQIYWKLNEKLIEELSGDLNIQVNY